MSDPTVFAGVRSYLFVPASEPLRIDKARDSGADAIVVDLEDGVRPSQKDRAREIVSERLAERRGRGLQLVRINALTTPYAEADLRCIERLRVDGVVIPKAHPEDLGTLRADEPPVVALIETALGIRTAYETASLPRVAAVMIGVVDLAAQLGTTPSAEGHELLFARSSLVVDSIAAGLTGPIDGPCTAIRDLEVVRAEALQAKGLGFVAKACIHPAQVPVIHEVFAHTEAELAWARRVVNAAEAAAGDGRGAIALDGEMIDAPVVARARGLLAAARD